MKPSTLNIQTICISHKADNKNNMNKQQLIDKIIETLGSDISQEQTPQYEYTSNHRPEDLIEDRTSFAQMILYADEMMYKIMAIRNLVLSQKQK